MRMLIHFLLVVIAFELVFLKTPSCGGRPRPCNPHLPSSCEPRRKRRRRKCPVCFHPNCDCSCDTCTLAMAQRRRDKETVEQTLEKKMAWYHSRGRENE